MRSQIGRGEVPRVSYPGLSRCVAPIASGQKGGRPDPGCPAIGQHTQWSRYPRPVWVKRHQAHPPVHHQRERPSGLSEGRWLCRGGSRRIAIRTCQESLAGQGARSESATNVSFPGREEAGRNVGHGANGKMGNGKWKTWPMGILYYSCSTAAIERISTPRISRLSAGFALPLEIVREEHLATL